ncbi:sigma-70 family RNA polymerase sigma factor [Opitutus sp. ER46]|uniref:RNA polymerase sigma factor n=1 Tax=Opitutus sp. ER46 TaxID=2161864 RepID=UPI000D2FA402|nr:sigma-70 family RNA polymerase sigma factor [Opitutus sp. ER46]PTX94344.1 hypothetical protein DB354_11335 [Opitutus sp. ER46]
MNSAATDHELLQAYLRVHSQGAFAELVRRHVDLVYSAARRQVGAEHAAREVAQLVFLDLARHAARIRPGQPLAPWLHVVTRRRAIDHIRQEARRVVREQRAAGILAMNEPGTDWSHVAPLLDAAIASLGEKDRTAVVLRYFQNRGLREVGNAMGLSDDAAQKRVGRALEKLRGYFLARGVTITAAGIAAEMSARAVQTAPVGLAAAIGAATPPVVGASISGWLAGALGRKLAVGALSAAIIGGTVVELHRHGQHAAQIDALRREECALGQHLQELGRQAKSAEQRTADIEARLEQRRREDPANELDTEVAAWFARVTQLKRLAAESPQWSVPEFRLLTERDWFELARDAKFDTDQERRTLLGTVRNTARQIAGRRLQGALVAYLDEHDGLLPAAISSLSSYLQPTLDPDILARYVMGAQGNVHQFDPDERLILEHTVVDEAYGTQLGIGRLGFEMLEATDVPKADFRRAVEAFAAAHADRLPQSPADLLPFFTQPLSPRAQEAFLKKPASDFAAETLGKLLTNH